MAARKYKRQSDGKFGSGASTDKGARTAVRTKRKRDVSGNKLGKGAKGAGSRSGLKPAKGGRVISKLEQKSIDKAKRRTKGKKVKGRARA